MAWNICFTIVLAKAWSLYVYKIHISVLKDNPPIFQNHNTSISHSSRTKDRVMELYKCDTFNLVLCDLLLTQTDRRSEEAQSCDTHLCVRTYRDPLLMQVTLVDKGQRLLNTSLVALFKSSHLSCCFQSQPRKLP